MWRAAACVLLCTAAQAEDLRGRVRVAGAPSRPPAIQNSAHQAVCGSSLPDESLIVDEATRGLTNVVVWLADAPAGAGLPAQDARLTAAGCRFSPRVQVMAAGQRLVLVNQDPIPLEVLATQNDSTVFSLSLPLKGQQVPKRLKDPGLVMIEARSGPSGMRAHVFVSATRHATVTGRDGGFELRGVSPGEYTLKAWHERLGETHKRVSVSKGKATTQDLVFAAH